MPSLIPLKQEEGEGLLLRLPNNTKATQLLRAQDRVLGGFGDAEFDHALGLDLNGLAGCWIAAHASFAIHQNNLAQSMNREGVLGVLIGKCNQSFQGLHSLLLR